MIQSITSLLRKLLTIILLIVINHSNLYSQERTGNLSASGSPTGNGCDYRVEMKVNFDVLIDDPNWQIIVNFTNKYPIRFNGKTYNEGEMTEEVLNKIEIYARNAYFDVYDESNYVTTMKFNQPRGMDYVKSATNWGNLFPGVSAKQAKELFEKGFKIRNLRVDASYLNMIEVEKAFNEIEALKKEKEKNQKYSNCISKADSYFNNQDWKRAQEKYYEAQKIDYTKKYPREQLDKINDEILKEKKLADILQQKLNEDLDKEEIANNSNKETSGEQNTASSKSSSSSVSSTTTDKSYYPTKEEFKKQQEEKFKQKQAADQQKFEDLKREKIKQKDEEFRNTMTQLKARGEAIDAAGNAASQYIDNQYKLMNDAAYKVAAYQSSLQRSTSLRETDDPYLIIQEFDDKMYEIQRKSNIELQRRLNAYKAQANQVRSSGTATDEISAKIVETYGSISAPKEIAKEKAKAAKELKRQKTYLLKKIQKKQLAVFKNNEKTYKVLASGALSADLERYYLNMSEYFECKKNECERDFSIEDTDWIDPYCKGGDAPKPNENTKPSGKDLYTAAKRKLKNSDYSFRKAGRNFSDYSLAFEPNNIEYLYLRSKFDKHGTYANRKFLKKILEVEPGNLKYQDELAYSEAVSINSFEAYKSYLSKHPKGRFSYSAKKLYDERYAQDKNRIEYNADVKKLNSLLENNLYSDATKVHDKLKTNSEYKSTDIELLHSLNDYTAFTAAKNAASNQTTQNKGYELLNEYIKNIEYWRFNKEAQSLLNDMYIKRAENFEKRKYFKSAIAQYKLYLRNQPQGIHATSAKKRIASINKRINFINQVNSFSFSYTNCFCDPTHLAASKKTFRQETFNITKWIVKGSSFYAGFYIKLGTSQIYNAIKPLEIAEGFELVKYDGNDRYIDYNVIESASSNVIGELYAIDRWDKKSIVHKMSLGIGGFANDYIHMYLGGGVSKTQNFFIIREGAVEDIPQLQSKKYIRFIDPEFKSEYSWIFETGMGLRINKATFMAGIAGGPMFWGVEFGYHYQF